MFQVACWQPLFAGEAPRVGQKVAAIHQMEMHLAQDKLSQKAVGLNLGASKVFSTMESLLKITPCHRVSVLCKLPRARCLLVTFSSVHARCTLIQ